MNNHPDIFKVIERISGDVIGGAADTAKEVLNALVNYSSSSKAQDPKSLASEIEYAVVDILRVSPSMAPPINALNHMMVILESSLDSKCSVEEIKNSLCKGGKELICWIDNALDRISKYGAEKINDGDNVFMYSMSSTVFRIFKYAKEQNKSFNVFVTESRPGNEGLWTVNEMLKMSIPVSVSIDACISDLVPEVDSIFVGADAISSDGTCLCKVGTYPTALVAKAHSKPFYVAADSLKFDPITIIGLPWRVESIHRHEVLSNDYPNEVKVVGLHYDQTPPELVTSVISELGIMNPIVCIAILKDFRLSEKMKDLLTLWSHGNL